MFDQFAMNTGTSCTYIIIQILYIQKVSKKSHEQSIISTSNNDLCKMQDKKTTHASVVRIHVVLLNMTFEPMAPRCLHEHRNTGSIDKCVCMCAYTYVCKRALVSFVGRAFAFVFLFVLVLVTPRLEELLRRHRRIDGAHMRHSHPITR